jgi:hypothetical protein
LRNQNLEPHRCSNAERHEFRAACLTEIGKKIDRSAHYVVLEPLGALRAATSLARLLRKQGRR